MDKKTLKQRSRETLETSKETASEAAERFASETREVYNKAKETMPSVGERLKDFAREGTDWIAQDLDKEVGKSYLKTGALVAGGFALTVVAFKTLKKVTGWMASAVSEATSFAWGGVKEVLSPYKKQLIIGGLTAATASLGIGGAIAIPKLYEKLTKRFSPDELMKTLEEKGIDGLKESVGTLVEEDADLGVKGEKLAQLKEKLGLKDETKATLTSMKDNVVREGNEWIDRAKNIEVSDLTAKRLEILKKDFSVENVRLLINALMQNETPVVMKEGKAFMVSALGDLISLEKWIGFQYLHSAGRVLKAPVEDPEAMIGSVVVQYFSEAPKFCLLFWSTDRMLNFFRNPGKRVGHMRSLLKGFGWGYQVPCAFFRAGKLVKGSYKLYKLGELTSGNVKGLLNSKKPSEDIVHARQEAGKKYRDDFFEKTRQMELDDFEFHQSMRTKISDLIEQQKSGVLDQTAFEAQMKQCDDEVLAFAKQKKDAINDLYTRFKKIPKQEITPALKKQIRQSLRSADNSFATRIVRGAKGRCKMAALVVSAMMVTDLVTASPEEKEERDVLEFFKSGGPMLTQLLIDVMPVTGTLSNYYSAISGEQIIDDSVDVSGGWARLSNAVWGTVSLAGDVVTVLSCGAGAAVVVPARLGKIVSKGGHIGKLAKKLLDMFPTIFRVMERSGGAAKFIEKIKDPAKSMAKLNKVSRGARKVQKFGTLSGTAMIAGGAVNMVYGLVGEGEDDIPDFDGLLAEDDSESEEDISLPDAV